jgi:ABC-type amino acid transport substrate-binding protein
MRSSARSSPISGARPHPSPFRLRSGHAVPEGKRAGRGVGTALFLVALVSLLVACGGPTYAADDPSRSLLHTVRSRGYIIVGTKYDVPTFGFLNPRTSQLEGFDVDLGKAIARQLLGSETSVEFKQARSADRIGFLNSGQVDLVLSTMTATEARAKQIDFTRPYYVAGQSLLVRADSPIARVDDLAGKTVCSVSGSTSEANIRKKAPQADVVLFGSYSECLQTIDTGRVDAMTTDDVILLGFVKTSPGRYKLVGGQITVEPYAGGVAQKDPLFLNAINDAIAEIVRSGEWQRIYERNLPGIPVPSEPPPPDWRDVYKMEPSAG